MRLWMTGYHLGLPLAILQWKATAWKNSHFYWNFVTLYSTQNGCGLVCVPYVVACKLMEESAIIGLPSYYSICPSQFMYQIKKFWLKASVLYEQLLSSVPYATICLRSLNTEQSINYFVPKLTFSSNLISFSFKNYFLEILVIQLRSAKSV